VSASTGARMTVDKLDVIRAYAFINVFLVVKAIFLVLRLSQMRGITGVFRHPEDKETVGKGSPTTTPEGEEKMRKLDRAHLNDLENLLPFFIGTTVWYYGFTLIPNSDTDTVNSDGIAFIVLCSLYAFSRVIHTICLLKGIQPWRTIIFTVGCLLLLLINAWGVGRVFKEAQVDD